MKIRWINLIVIITGLALSPGICFGITAEALQASMNRRENLTLIDARNNNAYRLAHIPGAINIAAQMCSLKNLPALGRTVVYGDGIDEEPVVIAARALNAKPGIEAEILEGGFLRWQALSFQMTSRQGLAPSKTSRLTYQRLKSVVRYNKDAVLVDLRNLPHDDRRTAETAVAGAAKKGFIDLSSEFAGAKVLTVMPAKDDSETGKRRVRIGDLIQGDKGHSRLYILIDNGDGSAGEIARQLKAIGIRRVAILTGGEEALARKGQSALEKK
jgi:rhodanese-related sulfurtransferase